MVGVGERIGNFSLRRALTDYTVIPRLNKLRAYLEGKFHLQMLYVIPKELQLKCHHSSLWAREREGDENENDEELPNNGAESRQDPKCQFACIWLFYIALKKSMILSGMGRRYYADKASPLFNLRFNATLYPLVMGQTSNDEKRGTVMRRALF